jgi:hypothetical protein
LNRLRNLRSRRSQRNGPWPSHAQALAEVAQAALAGDAWLWLVVAAYGWLAAFLPWVIRSAWIYLAPRVDGKPG